MNNEVKDKKCKKKRLLVSGKDCKTGDGWKKMKCW